MNCGWFTSCIRKFVPKKKNFGVQDHDLPLRTVTEDDFKIRDVVIILVYTKNDMIESLKRSRIRYYLTNLQKTGLKCESIESLTDRNVVFIRVSADTQVLYKYAPSLGVPLQFENPFFKESVREDHRLRHLATAGKDLDVELKSISQSLGNVKIREITQSEKLQIMYQVLKFVKYGFAEDEVGINRILNQNTMQTLYPTHDGVNELGYDKAVSDRYLLNNLWASWRFIFRRQPTFLIQKYFGAEVGFYFAHLNHLARMLIPASILGILTLIVGIISMYSNNNYKTAEVCSSDLRMCPTCYRNTCNYTYLNFSCGTSNFNHMIDNQMTVIYGVLISIWSTISFELWKRKQSSLAYQWNVYQAHTNVVVRPQYETTATLRKISPVTGEWEPYEDTALHILHTAVSIITMLVLCVVSVLAIVGITIYYNRLAITLALTRLDPTDHFQVTEKKILASTIAVILMITFDLIYKHIVHVLVNYENPRTEQEYDNSYILKIYILTFINSFGVAIYIAFFKGRFNDYPGNLKGSYFNSDTCDVTGCAENLFIHIFVVLMFKCIVKDLYNLAKINFRDWWRNYKIKKLYSDPIPSYEEEYYMKKPTRFFLVNQYKEIAIQYGYITFFSSAQPLAPLIVLLHTLAVIRLDAKKLTRNYRRPIPISTPNIGAWMQVFMAMTHLGVVTNALVIGWTMSFVPSAIYKAHHVTEPYYYNRFAIFDTDDYPPSIKNMLNVSDHPKTCRYISVRYPPEHSKKYQFNGHFWHEVTWIMAFIIIFEHVVLAITSIIAYCIPDIPAAIKQMMEYENMKMVKANYQKMGEVATDDSDLQY